MIYTSYFAKAKYGRGTEISIANSQPKSVNLTKYQKLVPPWDIVSAWKNKQIDWDEFTKQYTERVLNKLNPNDIATELDGCILCCWEKDFRVCHRTIVRKWLKKHGVDCEELDFRANEEYWFK